MDRLALASWRRRASWPGSRRTLQSWALSRGTRQELKRHKPCSCTRSVMLLYNTIMSAYYLSCFNHCLISPYFPLPFCHASITLWCHHTFSSILSCSATDLARVMQFPLHVHTRQSTALTLICHYTHRVCVTYFRRMVANMACWHMH